MKLILKVFIAFGVFCLSNAQNREQTQGAVATNSVVRAM